MSDKGLPTFRELADAIDDTWKSSWHWDTKDGSLTDLGWQQAYESCQNRIDHLQERLDICLKLRDRLDNAGVKEPV